MKFFFPDSQDQIDPTFDFVTEERSILRVRQRDDLYAHEALEPGTSSTASWCPRRSSTGCPAPPGNTPWRSAIASTGPESGSSSASTPPRATPLLTMGDCGAFSYVRDDVPPYTPGRGHRLLRRMRLRPRHLHRPRHLRLRPGRRRRPGPPAGSRSWKARQQLTLDLAEQFLGRVPQPEGPASRPWASPRDGVRHPTPQLSATCRRSATRASLSAAWSPSRPTRSSPASRRSSTVRDPGTQLHLLGITRCSNIGEFASLGVTSFDSTSAFRQAFKDDRDNYHTADRTYTALRVPQVDGNPKLKSTHPGRPRFAQQQAIRLEQACLQALRGYDCR